MIISNEILKFYNFVAASVKNYDLDIRPYGFNPKTVVPYYIKCDFVKRE